MTPETSFVAIGECMVEIAPAERGLYALGFAGDSFNTAWYARRLLPSDWRVGYASAVGADALSDQMLGFMQGEGVETGLVRRVDARGVGLYLIQVLDGERSFLYWRDSSAARVMADDPAWLERIAGARGVLYFSGITLAILTPEARRALCAALSLARHNGAHVAFDTNLRPRLWADKDEMREGLLLGASVSDTVLPSFDEERWLFGDDAPSATIARYRDAGAALIAVKNGGGPCTLWREGGTGEAEIASVPAAQVVDSTAAGDSFGAALLCGLARGVSLDAAAGEAMALAAKVIGQRGALARAIFDEETKR